MKLSVIIPAYNEEKYISKCLDSLIAQQVKADEIIVVNNNSTDNTLKIISQYPIRVVNETKKGVIFAKQTGFLEAKNEIIAYLDADSIAPPDWIKKIKQHFIVPNVVGVSGPYTIIDGPNYQKIWVKISLGLVNILYRHFNWLTYLSGSNLAFRRSIARKFNCFDIDKTMGEDEMGIGTKLKNYGLIVWDNSLVIKTSGRRANGGFFNFVEHILFRYSLNYLTCQIFGKPLFPPFTDFR